MFDIFLLIIWYWDELYILPHLSARTTCLTPGCQYNLISYIKNELM
ncbi:hypothetical protein BACFIN_05438 [Bacteroides finegoldii DSM 17565]|nr:hypothetical protein BACFIN_05438 [Bacteroides finegoldii DSM 17565]